MIDATHWDRLRAMDPADVCRRSLATFDAATGEYDLPLLSDRLRVSPERRSVAWACGERAAPLGGSPANVSPKPPGFHHWLVSVVYLIGAQNRPAGGDWVQARMLPMGDFFFRGPHVLPTEPVAKAFGDRPEAFAQAARSLGGKAWPGEESGARMHGGLAFEMPALPRVPILVQFWERDEEFPARAGFLLDHSACDHLAVDAIWSLTIIVAKRLVEEGS